MAPIRRLPGDLVDRIAAGEVVERPASAVKELVENAIDAGASSIKVTIAGGGVDLILVEDDGCGIGPDDLPLALERHATSKLADDHLTLIETLGFRGEALPSIASVARLTITGRTAACPHAHGVTVEAGAVGATKPAAGGRGTRVEVRDLFANVPARRKFLKSARYEGERVLDVVRRLALARPDVALSLTIDGREVFAVPPEPDLGQASERLRHVMGRDFLPNAVPVEAEVEGLSLRGLAGLPTLSRNHGRLQHLSVNRRPVEDRLLKGALRAAYADVMAQGRQPLAVLRLTIDPDLVDVNVHPAKAEVRFKDAGRVRHLLVSALKDALRRGGARVADTVAGGGLTRWRPGGGGMTAPRLDFRLAEAAVAWQEGGGGAATALLDPPEQRPATAAAPAPPVTDAPLGTARAQVFDTYIIAETADGIVLVDVHAAHERIVYERLKAELDTGGVRRQALLLPDVVELPAEERDRLAEHVDTLARFGLVVEPFGDAIVVREAPAALKDAPLEPLLRDVAHDLADTGEPLALERALLAVLSRASCHGSIRAGRRLAPPEMDALLRQMEATPRAGQCNHGRPTHVALGRDDIERLFKRR